MPPSNSRQKKIRAATRKLKGNARHLAFIRALRENRFNRARRGTNATHKAPKLTKKQRESIAKEVSMSVNSQLRRSARTKKVNGNQHLSAKERVAERVASASKARAASAKTAANLRRAARAEPELEELADRLAATLNTSGPKKSAPTHHLATSAERRRRLATIAEGANEPNES